MTEVEPPFPSEDALQRGLAQEGTAELKLTPLHQGENHTYRVQTPEGQWALRVYRRNGCTEETLRAEWAFAAELARRWSNPPAEVVRLAEEAPWPALRKFGHNWLCLQDWVPGLPLDMARPQGAQTIAEVLGPLRRFTDQFRPAPPLAACLRARPHFSATHLAVGVLGLCKGAPSALLSLEQARLLSSLHEVWQERARAEDLRATSLLHADLHAGNLLRHQDRLTLIDFDDAMWGPPEMEWAQLRVHLQRRGETEARFPNLLAASGLKDEEPRIRLATAGYILFVLPRFAALLDLPTFSRPREVVERYLGYLHWEMAPFLAS